MAWWGSLSKIGNVIRYRIKYEGATTKTLLWPVLNSTCLYLIETGQLQRALTSGLNAALNGVNGPEALVQRCLHSKLYLHLPN